jgi:hypothetical protein
VRIGTIDQPIAFCAERSFRLLQARKTPQNTIQCMNIFAYCMIRRRGGGGCQHCRDGRTTHGTESQYLIISYILYEGVHVKVNLFRNRLTFASGLTRCWCHTGPAGVR